jgi:hypothetical protein
MLNNIHFAQIIPCTAIHYVTGTWTMAAGAVAGTIAKHKAAGAETAVVTVPVQIPSNSIGLQGCKLQSIELDYQLIDAAAVGVTAVLHKVARGIEGAAASASHPTITESPAAAAGAETQNKHKLVVTLSTPEWIDNDVYFLCEFSFECAGVVTIDILAAVVNYTFRA